MSLIEKFNVSQASSIILSVAVMLIIGFLFTRITKKLHLPNVTAYIIAGIIIGPNVLNIIPISFINGSSFLADIALAFIAFSTGEFLRIDTFKNSGKVILITLFESLLASILVFIVTYFILKINSLPFCIVLSALASATAPASTMMTIRQTGSKGEFVNILLQVIALDDIVALLCYSIAIEISKSEEVGFSVVTILKTMGINIGIVLLGGLFGFLLKCLLPTKRTKDNRLIIAVAMLFTFCGICAPLGQSPLLGCMAMGIMYSNISKDDKLFKQLNYFSPPLLLLFFVRSGTSFNLNSLFNASSISTVSLLVIGIIYFITRIIGKYAGSFIGLIITKQKKEIRNYLGLALIPQAGVAIGLAALGAREIGGELGDALQTIILASSVLYELIGPACAKLSLYLSHSYTTNVDEVIIEEIKNDGTPKTEVEKLIERINEIKKNIPEHEKDEEEVFTEEAYEYFSEQYHRPGMIGRRK